MQAWRQACCCQAAFDERTFRRHALMKARACEPRCEGQVVISPWQMAIAVMRGSGSSKGARPTSSSYAKQPTCTGHHSSDAGPAERGCTPQPAHWCCSHLPHVHCRAEPRCAVVYVGNAAKLCLCGRSNHLRGHVVKLPNTMGHWHIVQQDRIGKVAHTNRCITALQYGPYTYSTVYNALQAASSTMQWDCDIAARFAVQKMQG
jgi:hypothetical protein